jgi:Protein of unknown function (DUF4199)
MKQTVLRYGIYAAMLIVALMVFNLFFLPKVASFAIQEVAGYLSILLSMIFVFLGVRHFRDHVNGGALSFIEGLKLGLLIALIPSVFFGLFDLLYTQVINPGWQEDYYNHYVQELKASTPADKLTAELEKLENQRKLFSKPYMEFLLMFLTVFVIGAIVTIISALTLRRNKSALA